MASNGVDNVSMHPGLLTALPPQDQKLQHCLDDATQMLMLHN